MTDTDSPRSGGEQPPGAPARPLLRIVTGYGLMLLVAAIALFFIQRAGGSIAAPPAAELSAAKSTGAANADIFLRVLIALAAVIVTGLVLAKLFSFIGQPPVIGEVVAGIVLGPSLLGPEASAFILPPAVAPYLGVIAQLGVLLYMFAVGLELHADMLRHRAHATVATSHASILLPFVLGMALALWLYPRLSSSDVPFMSFAMFMGVAMSITAFPVLARILTDRGMHGTELGVIALSCAAADDVTAWCLLAFVVGIAKSRVGDAVGVALGTLAYIAAILFVVRPLLKRLFARWHAEDLSQSHTAYVIVALLISALATEAIGIHAIFGAFLLGAVIPHDSVVARTFSKQMHSVVTVLLLPAFFAFTGMRTRIDLVSGSEQWLYCGLIIVVATGGKFVGTFVAGRLTGLGWRNAAALGALMNTRGLMELIVLNIGLDLGVISPTLFAMMVLMALATTMATAPAVHWLLRPDRARVD